MFFKSTVINPMSLDQIQKRAPAVFADRPHSKTSYGKDSSNAYLFLPTINIVEGLAKNGWSVVAAEQTMNAKSDIEARMTNKHALFFARTDSMGRNFNAGDVMPLVKLENSHNGLSSFGLSTGFFRKACANGLTVPESIYAAPKVKHTINLSNDVVEATYKVLNDFPMLMDMQKQLSSLMLTNEEKLLIGDAAADIFFNKEDRQALDEVAHRSGRVQYSLDAQLLTPQRWSDKGNDLWTVTNVIQENLIRGNVRVVKEGSRNLQSKRKVTSIERDNDIHEKLFKITQHFARERGLKIGAVA